MKNFYLTNQSDLRSVIDLTKQVKLFAIDTEFMRERTYYPILSLIQIAVKNSSEEKFYFTIDCLSGLDLSELFAIIADTKITKIFHSCTQDLQIFYHYSKLMPSGIVDTQVMANICGFNLNAGYLELVKKFFQISLDKNQQRSDWQQRPLTQEQLDYAIADVIYLEEIYEKLLATLCEKKRENWLKEEMEIFMQKTFSKDENNLFRKFIFKANATQKQVSQIRNLILWREEKAKEYDVPRRHFLGDEIIIKIATDQNFKVNLNQKLRSEIEEVLGREEVFFEKEKNSPMSQKQKNLYEESKKLIAKIASEENLREQLLITAPNLKSLICQHKKIDEIISGWRYELFGEELKKILTQ